MKTLFAVSALALAIASPAHAATFIYTSAPVVFVDGGEVITPITVTGLTGTLTSVSIRLNGFRHTFPSDMVFGLRNETANRGIVFLSGAGGSTPVTNVNLTFADTAAAQVPAVLTSGTYRPSNFDGYTFTAGTNITTFGGFAGLSPNGLWQLYSDDVFAADTGGLSGGYTLTLVTADGAVPEPSTWALMIGGFGLAGGALRRRRQVRVSFAA